MREVAERSEVGGREHVSFFSPPVSFADSPLVRGGQSAILLIMLSPNGELFYPINGTIMPPMPTRMNITPPKRVLKR